MSTGFVFDERYMWHDTGSAVGAMRAGSYVQPDKHNQMTLLLKKSAHELCEGRLVMVHEGGYSTAYVPFCGLAVMEALSGIKTEVEDPFLEAYESLPGQQLQKHQNAVIETCAKMASKM